jgi:hypothetical protein
MIQNSYNTSGKPEQSEEEMNRMVEELTEVQGFIFIKNYIFKKNYFPGMRSHILWAVLARDKSIIFWSNRSGFISVLVII